MTSSADPTSGEAPHPTEIAQKSPGAAASRAFGLIGEFWAGADAFDVEFSGGNLSGGFALLAGPVECSGVAGEHAAEDRKGALFLVGRGRSRGRPVRGGRVRQQVGITLGIPIMSAVATATLNWGGAAGSATILTGITVAIGVNALLCLVSALLAHAFLRDTPTDAASTAGATA